MAAYTDPTSIMASFLEDCPDTAEDMVSAINNRLKRSSKSDQAILLVLRVALDQFYEDGPDAVPLIRNFLKAVIFTYIAGSTFRTKLVTKDLTTKAIKDRKKKNAVWVQPFNNAIRRAHRAGLEGGLQSMKPVKNWRRTA
jgi:hypothetical protein